MDETYVGRNCDDLGKFPAAGVVILSYMKTWLACLILIVTQMAFGDEVGICYKKTITKDLQVAEKNKELAESIARGHYEGTWTRFECLEENRCAKVPPPFRVFDADCKEADPPSPHYDFICKVKFLCIGEQGPPVNHNPHGEEQDYLEEPIPMPDEL